MKIPIDLIDACKNKKCIPFIGAGMSVQSGLSTWSDIISEISDILSEKSEDPKSELMWIKDNGALEIADRFKTSLTPANYQKYLDKWFDTPGLLPSDAHNLLFSIKWPFLVTTNFDRLLELAYSNVCNRMARIAITFEQLVRAEATNSPYILKLHGSVDDPESVILTETDYARMGTERKDMLDHIEKNIMTFKRLLFIGFSMKDPEIRSAFLRSRISAKGYAVGDFIVLTAPHKADVEIWEARGLTVISLNGHDELPLFLDELSCLISTDLSIITQTPPQKKRPSQTKSNALGCLPPLPFPLVNLNIFASDERYKDKGKRQYTLPKEFKSFLRLGGIISIIGEAGSGKSTILSSATSYLKENRLPFLFIKAAQLDTERLSLRKFVTNLVSSNQLKMTVLVDGLDECRKELASSIISDLCQFSDNEREFCAIVTSRPIKLPEFQETNIYIIQPLSEQDFLTLAQGEGQNTSHLRNLFNLAPSLHGRPLHAQSIGNYVHEIGVEPESEADYALWLLEHYYSQQGIDKKYQSWIELTASQLYISKQSFIWSLADWAQSAQEILPQEEQHQAVIGSVSMLIGEDKLFIPSQGKLIPRHRTAFEAMVGKGLSHSGGLDKFLTIPGPIDESSIMLACLIKSLPPNNAKKNLGVVINRAPWLAARVMLGAGAQSGIRELLLDSEFELDLSSAIRHGVAILGASSFIDFVSPLFSRDLRNPTLLSEAVDTLESLCSTLPRGREKVRASALLNQLWAEHEKCTLSIDWVDVPGGYFKCGTNNGLDVDEEPEHTVFLNPFRLSIHQITNLLYEQFSPLYKRDRLSLEDDMPAVNVTWHESQLFCRWISGNKGGRLPTEAEWETAARGGTTTRFYWGNDFDPSMANCGENMRGMTRVGAFPPNPIGLYDMAGNVYEWCFDWYDDRYYVSCPKLNPKGPLTGRMKSMRGGSWGRSANAAASAYRVRQVPETRDVLVGFRACWPHQS